MSLTPRNIVLAGVAGGFLLVLGALLALPRLLEGPVADRLADAANDKLYATLTWSDLDVTLFRDFPDVTVSLTGAVLDGAGPWEGERLADIRALSARVSLASALSDGPLIIESVSLDHPVIRLLTSEEGANNWDLVPNPAAAPNQGRGVSLDIAEATVTAGAFVLSDASSGLRAEADNLDVRLDAGVRADGARLDGALSAGAVTLDAGGLRLLDALPMALDLDGTWGSDGRTLDLTALLSAAELAVSTAGRVTLAETPTADLTFEAQSPDVGALLALVPTIDRDRLAALSTAGSATLRGSARGPLTGAGPTVHARLQIADGSVTARDVVLGSLHLDAWLHSPGEGLDALTAEIDALTWTLQGAPFSARGSIGAPLSRLDIDASAEGALDLRALAAVLPVLPLRDAAGTVELRAQVQGPMRRVAERDLSELKASGTVDLSQLAVPLHGTDLRVTRAKLTLADADLALTDVSGFVGGSDFSVDGTVRDALGSLLLDKPLRGEVSLRSEVFDLDEVLAAASPPEAAPIAGAAPIADAPITDAPITDASTPTIPRLPAGFDVALDVNVASLGFQGVAMTDVRGRAALADRALDLSNLQVSVFGGDATMNGLWDTAPEAPTVALTGDVDRVSVRAAMSALPWLDDLAPIAEGSEGRVTARIALNGAVGEDGQLAVDSLTGDGRLVVNELRIDSSEVLGLVADALANTSFRDFALDGASLNVTVNDGRVHVAPFRFDVATIGVLASGSHGLDQTLDYQLRMAVPAKQLLGKAEQELARLLEGSPFARAQLDLGDTVQVVARIRGTLSKPRVSLAVDELLKGAGAVAVEQVRKVAQEALDDVAERADAFLASAQARAEAVQAQAIAVAEQTRDRLYTLADQAADEASSPVAKLAAKAAATAAKKQADRGFDKAIAEAKAAYQSTIQRAREEADAMVSKGTTVPDLPSGSSGEAPKERPSKAAPGSSAKGSPARG